MHIYLYNNSSEVNKIGKSLQQIADLEGSIKEPSSITEPVITIDYGSVLTFNYVYIPDFNRYYFVRDIVVILNNIIKISLKVDVLQSFKDAILSNSVILSDTETTGATTYLSGDVWKSTVKENTDIIQFPTGLLNSGEFILITAGG